MSTWAYIGTYCICQLKQDDNLVSVDGKQSKLWFAFNFSHEQSKLEQMAKASDDLSYVALSLNSGDQINHHTFQYCNKKGVQCTCACQQWVQHACVGGIHKLVACMTLSLFHFSFIMFICIKIVSVGFILQQLMTRVYHSNQGGVALCWHSNESSITTQNYYLSSLPAYARACVHAQKQEDYITMKLLFSRQVLSLCISPTCHATISPRA